VIPKIPKLETPIESHEQSEEEPHQEIEKDDDEISGLDALILAGEIELETGSVEIHKIIDKEVSN
jgi:hypothetical protein